MKIYKNILKLCLLLVTAFSMFACNDPNSTGWEFAPNMYNSRAYEAQTQWRENGVNPHGMNMRLPVEGTVSKRMYNTKFMQDDSTWVEDLMMYDIPKDSFELAGRVLVNPISWSETVEKEGQVLYEKNCLHCHGKKGDGQGKVGIVYKGVPNYASDAYKNMPEGRIYHAITHGKGRMWPHSSQVLPEERWKIVHYVQRLQLGS